ncbi:DNAase [Vibrio sp. B1FLJ16]|uniref:DNAase n=1 Tax=Vibrio sp. B1FLJ16 TaxID=2751178 RepID=UPI0015F69404|nr:DNAase [Vibrio sp. B1FLJ16]CAD7824348.1 hypothetical protein ACOMICROBIO_EPCKBFOG_04544 [Vibrio sp. B1FLJ16]CAE6954341.1 hypothetical protein ACOMICROBIO_EPCKBFOG_04544 [Vibrio sp. B1FLJ16]
MCIFSYIKDGFRGKPDFSETLSNSFQIDDLLLSFECPNNIQAGCVYQDKVKLDDFCSQTEIERHEKALNLAYVLFSFNKVIPNPIFPVNLQGRVFITLRIKSANKKIYTIEELSYFLQKDYFDFYHDSNPSEDSMRGSHTEMMNDAYRWVNYRYGEEPETEEQEKKKEDYLIDAFMRAYPPIKCETVNIGRNTYSKYIEGNLKYKRDYRRVYNLPIKDKFFISIEFKCLPENYHRDKKLISWIRTADEAFEYQVLERLEISLLIDSAVEPNIEKISVDSGPHSG